MALMDKCGKKAHRSTITDRNKYLLCDEAREPEATKKFNDNYNRIFRKGKATWKDKL